jgi:hypothetical protein
MVWHLKLHAKCTDKGPYYDYPPPPALYTSNVVTNPPLLSPISNHNNPLSISRANFLTASDTVKFGIRNPFAHARDEVNAAINRAIGDLAGDDSPTHDDRVRRAEAALEEAKKERDLQLKIQDGNEKEVHKNGKLSDKRRNELLEEIEENRKAAKALVTAAEKDLEKAKKHK